jgi:hypothetical protein
MQFANEDQLDDLVWLQFSPDQMTREADAALPASFA